MTAIDDELDALATLFSRRMPAPWRLPGVQLCAFTAEIPYRVSYLDIPQRYAPGAIGRALRRQSECGLPAPRVVAKHELTIEYGMITGFDDSRKAVRMHGVSVVPVQVGDPVSMCTVKGTYRQHWWRPMVDVVDAGFVVELSICLSNPRVVGARIVDVGDDTVARSRLAAL